MLPALEAFQRREMLILFLIFKFSPVYETYTTRKRSMYVRRCRFYHLVSL
jgi:hypothetical protein